jgi:RNA polymerase sigma factor (sigma-70 family)
LSTVLTDEDRRLVQRHIDALCPVWLRSEREDLAQVAILKLLRSDTEIRHRSALFRQVAYSVVVDEIRYRKRRNVVGMSPSLPERIVNSKAIDPETRAMGTELGLKLVACLEGLAPERRRVVTLYLQSHRVPEIAEILGMDRKRVSNLVYRGMADLRAALRAAGVDR